MENSMINLMKSKWEKNIYKVTSWNLQQSYQIKRYKIGENGSAQHIEENKI